MRNVRVTCSRIDGIPTHCILTRDTLYGDVLIVPTVVDAVRLVYTLRERRLIALTFQVVQPDDTRARTVAGAAQHVPASEIHPIVTTRPFRYFRELLRDPD